MRISCLIIIILLSFIISIDSNILINSKGNSNNKIDLKQNTISNDFYFVHITDTHIMHKFFDHNEISKNKLKSVLDRICSFNNKPAFIVITGDLTEWGGNKISGALNFKEFISCFYEKDKQFYADKNYSIPIYTTPGNHDYYFNRNLNNYFKFIKNEENYIVNYKDVSLFFINSGSNYYSEPDYWLNLNGNGLNNYSIEWLNNSLNNCSSKNKIILMHHTVINKRNNQGEMVDVIANNREEFIELCNFYNIDIVLTGHTHNAIIYDSNEKILDELPINCSNFNTIFVQSDDCKQGLHYRNITISQYDIWIEKSEEIYSINYNC